MLAFFLDQIVLPFTCANPARIFTKWHVHFFAISVEIDFTNVASRTTAPQVYLLSFFTCCLFEIYNCGFEKQRKHCSFKEQSSAFDVSHHRCLCFYTIFHGTPSIFLFFYCFPSFLSFFNRLIFPMILITITNLL